MLHIRSFFERANKEIFDIEKVCDFLVGNLMSLFVLYLRDGNTKSPFLARGSQYQQNFVVAFTDREAVDKVRLSQAYDVELVEEPILPFLIQTYRSDVSGLILNVGLPSRFFFQKEHLHQLIVEYAVNQLAQMPGAWIPTMQQHMLLVEYEKDRYTVAIYSSKKDAELMCQEAGGSPVLHPWKAVFERAQKVGAQSLYLHFHLPEQEYLSAKHIEKIWRGRHEGYRELNSVTHTYRVQPIALEMDSSHSKQETREPQPLEQSVREEKEGISNSDLKQEQQVESQQLQNSTSTVEDTQSEVKSTEEEKVKYPSERVNPYSIKNKKELELEIYRGSKQINEDIGVTLKKESEPADQKGHVLTEPVKQSKRPESKQPEKVSQAGKKGNQGVPTDVREGLERLEKATIEGQGMANGWEVCQVLAEIRRIWIIVDQQENMVILAGQDQSPIVDFFTSDVYAQRLIDEAHANNPNLPPMSPQLVSTKKLYRALSLRQPIVWINRGSSGAWTSVMGDTLPYVLQLMAQREKERI